MYAAVFLIIFDLPHSHVFYGSLNAFQCLYECSLLHDSNKYYHFDVCVAPILSMQSPAPFGSFILFQFWVRPKIIQIENRLVCLVKYCNVIIVSNSIRLFRIFFFFLVYYGFWRSMMKSNATWHVQQKNQVIK